MKWTYIKDKRRLNVFGTDSERDAIIVKKLIEEGKIPNDLDAIVYRKSSTSQTAMIIRGVYLYNLLTPEPNEAQPRVVRPGIKTILRVINDNNERQGHYAGVIFYSLTSRRMMFVTPRGRNQPAVMLGDFPAIEDETPTDIVCRVAIDDTQIEIDPKWLIPLTSVEVDETTYHGFMVLVEKEFKPALSARLVNSFWCDGDNLPELRLHKSIREMIEKDPHLQKLSAPDPVDFDAIIEAILQEQRTLKETK